MRNFSTIHAASPAGESDWATVSESGFVRCSREYAASWVRQTASRSSACASSGPASGGGGATSMFTWMPTTRSGYAAPSLAATIAPQSPPCAP